MLELRGATLRHNFEFPRRRTLDKIVEINIVGVE
jgi:hypothetical protein